MDDKLFLVFMKISEGTQRLLFVTTDLEEAEEKADAYLAESAEEECVVIICGVRVPASAIVGCRAKGEDWFWA